MCARWNLTTSSCTAGQLHMVRQIVDGSRNEIYFTITFYILCTSAYNNVQQNTPDSGQCNLFALCSSRDGSRYAIRDSADYRESPLADLVKVGRQGPDQPPGLQEICGRYERVLTELMRMWSTNTILYITSRGPFDVFVSIERKTDRILRLLSL